VSPLALISSRTPPPSIPLSTIRTQSDAMLHGSLSPSVPPADSEDTDGKVNLRGFAFIGSRPSMNDSSSRLDNSRKRSSTVIEPSANAPPPKKAVTKHPFSTDFSNAGLAKLTKCVSCNVQWTTRKTAAQKINHIQSCAKKHSFNDETIRFLIRKEIESVVGNVGGTADKKGKGKSSVPPAESPTPKTFYEHIVADATPRKKGRRREAGESVRSVTATRNTILDRARVVLDSVASEYPIEGGIGSPAYMSTIGTGNFDCPFSPTQLFGQSTLAKKHQTDRHYILAASSALPSSSKEEENPLPATQAFAPSKFGGAIHRPCEPFKSRKDVLPFD
jgi:hypothetical protein